MFQLAVSFDFDVLDLHFYLRHHLDSRGRDGIHWDYWAHRTISSMILSHICEAWNLPQPSLRKTFKSYGSRAIRQGAQPPSLFQFGQAQNQINYPRTANLNNLQFQFGQNKSFPKSSSRMLPGFNVPVQSSAQRLNGLGSSWMPYQQQDCYGYASSSHRSRHNPYSQRPNSSNEHAYRNRRY